MGVVCVLLCEAGWRRRLIKLDHDVWVRSFRNVRWRQKIVYLWTCNTVSNLHHCNGVNGVACIGGVGAGSSSDAERPSGLATGSASDISQRLICDKQHALDETTISPEQLLQYRISAETCLN
jgi:hypothetical protein